jgi:hypothetical protein
MPEIDFLSCLPTIPTAIVVVKNDEYSYKLDSILKGLNQFFNIPQTLGFYGEGFNKPLCYVVRKDNQGEDCNAISRVRMMKLLEDIAKGYPSDIFYSLDWYWNIKSESDAIFQGLRNGVNVDQEICDRWVAYQSSQIKLDIAKGYLRQQ